MRKPNMILTNKLYLLLVICTVGASFACKSDLTAETTGQITRVVLDRDQKTTRRKTSSNRNKKRTTTTYDTEIDYRYTVDGKSYEGFSEKDGDVQRDYQAGAQLVVCYNPKDPSESDIFTAGQKCGNGT
jgi:hypothetical protein